jgi:hypothetical protein
MIPTFVGSSDMTCMYVTWVVCRACEGKGETSAQNYFVAHIDMLLFFLGGGGYDLHYTNLIIRPKV